MYSMGSYSTFPAPERLKTWRGLRRIRMTLGWCSIEMGTVQSTMDRNYSETSLLIRYPRLALKEMDSLHLPNMTKQLMVVITMGSLQIRTESFLHCDSGRTLTIMAYLSRP